MKYKIGDKVKIKTWGELEKEYGIKKDIVSINCAGPFIPTMEKKIEELNCNRILTIKSVSGHTNYYSMKEISMWSWSDDMIKCLIKNNIIKDDIESGPITSRFEILDIR